MPRRFFRFSDFLIFASILQSGYCQDHIFAKRSTIQQAGQGAFSRRFLPKGTLVISAPTIATDRYYMHLNTTMTKEEINPQELMINYHWGHKNSSILFFPLNHAFTINHNSKRKISGKEPNVRVEFSSREKRSRYFRERSLEDLRKEKYSTIVLDFIAIRDIYPDEEIFLDYGKQCQGLRHFVFVLNRISNMSKNR